MFPLQIYVPYAVFSYYGLYFIIQSFQGIAPLRITKSSGVGLLTVLGIMLLMRIFDEFKDLETDKKLFPHRPLARKAVTESDLKILGWTVFLFITALNIFLGNVFFTYLAAIFFAFLTFKWFFNKELISNNLVLALITHQPITLFVNFYIVFTAFYCSGNFEFSSNYIVVIFAFFFPLTAWETSRKIRALGKETDYITYSKLFGPQKATLIPLFSLLLTFAFVFIIAINLSFSFLFYFIEVLMLLIFSFFYFRFIFYPSEKNLVVKPVAEYTGTGLFILLLVQIITKSGVVVIW